MLPSSERMTSQPYAMGSELGSSASRASLLPTTPTFGSPGCLCRYGQVYAMGTMYAARLHLNEGWPTQAIEQTSTIVTVRSHSTITY